MCRNLTPDKEKVPCSRCGETANPTDGWEHGWPLYGRIHLGIPSQSFAKLCGKAVSDKEAYELWEAGHPAMASFDAQEVVFEWGYGFEYDSKGRYRLCLGCQSALFAVVGEFFGFPQQATEVQEKESAGVES